MLFKCNMCNSKFEIKTCLDSINKDVIEGALSIGIGFTNSEELFKTLDVPFMSSNLYLKLQKEVGKTWEKLAIDTMKTAAQEEAEYALSTGSVDSQGIPLITVVADGCWSKRSYKTKYNALSGAAAIIGKKTGKVLFYGVKNKFCATCLTGSTKEHNCPKNYTGSSTGMEGTILVEGFLSSEDLYGVKFAKFIADGDSSTYNKILEARPYGMLQVQKIECRNHLLRNFVNKLKNLSEDTKCPLQCRKLLKGNILRFRGAIKHAIEYRKKENNLNGHLLLKNDIDNSINHIFGKHRSCSSYFCSKDDALENFNIIRNHNEFFMKLLNIVSSISNHAKSLIEDVDSNVVEEFNSVVAKFVGGKRINYARGFSYQYRCAAAVVSFNTKRPHVHFKNFYGRSPPLICAMEKKRYEKVKRYTKKKPTKRNYATQDSNYGTHVVRPDLPEDVFEVEAATFLNRMRRSPNEIVSIERRTIKQSGCGEWQNLRKYLLTASNFYDAYFARTQKQFERLIKKIIYPELVDLSKVPAIRHGKKYEGLALRQLAQQEDITISENGLFIDQNINYLGATPDGLVDDFLIVEIKCPYSAFKMHPEEAIASKKITFWKDGKINMKHPWFYQIQGQLHITGRKGCLFGVWTNYSCPLKIEYIRARPDFWNGVEEKLKDFYTNVILPEIVDPRYIRGMPLRTYV